MPFWEKIKRCEFCRHWRSRDPNDVLGTCEAESMGGAPFWAKPRECQTSYGEGTDCAAYAHDAHKPHPLDKATGFLLGVNVGDTIGMRTYQRRGNTSYCNAQVLRVSKNMVSIAMMNSTFRIRIHAEKRERHRAGTVIGMDEWGVDLDAPVIKVGHRYERPERGEDMLKRASVGQQLPLIGYPPFDGMRKLARVTAVYPDKLTLVLVNGKRRMKMYRKGAMAGLIEGEPWCLDTTEEVNHGT